MEYVKTHKFDPVPFPIAVTAIINRDTFWIAIREYLLCTINVNLYSVPG